MTMSVKSNAALIEDNPPLTEVKEEVIQDYKNYNEKCEAVLDKINKRKKNNKIKK